MKTKPMPEKPTLTAFLVGATLLMATAMPVNAESSNGADGWSFDAALYFWYSDINGTESVGSTVEIEADDILDDLDEGFLGIFRARKDKWFVMADVIYLSLSDEEKGVADVPVGPGVTAPLDASVDLTGKVFTFTGGRNFVDSKQTSFDWLVGARYLDLDAELTLDLGAPAPPSREKFSDSGDVWDAVIGFNGQIHFTEQWYLSLYGDIGTGDSESTWQAYAGLGYHFDAVDLEFAYRHIEWDFDDSPVFDDLEFQGPMVGLNYRF